MRASSASSIASSASSSSIFVTAAAIVERERHLEQRARGEQLVGVGGEAREATADHVADAGGDAEIGRRATQTPFDLAQPPFVDEVQQRLAQEERVAVGLGREQRGELRRHGVAGEPLEQRLHVVGPEAVERDAGRLDLALQQRERRGERMAPVEVRLAVGADDRRAASVRGDARQGAQHPDGRVVGPVEVLHDEHDRGSPPRAGCST